MKDAFVPSSVLRLRRRLSEDKMINIDIADVLFAGMVFPVMKFVKKIVLPRVRKAWEKVKEVAKKMSCTEAPPVSDLESQSESNGNGRPRPRVSVARMCPQLPLCESGKPYSGPR